MQTEVKDNPYVAVVAKKHRNLKKKWGIHLLIFLLKHNCSFIYIFFRMEKIIKIEAQIQSGKALDEEQKIMYTLFRVYFLS